MKKPYVICHMASSVNGKIITANWGDPEKRKLFSSLYEECHTSYNSQGWMCGRVTMEKDFSKGEKPVLVQPAAAIERVSFIGDSEADSFAIAIDAKGKLGWPANELGGDHIISVLTEGVSDAYLHYLQQKKVSYIFAGKEEVDFALVLEQLVDLFGIKTLMLEGGGVINGSLLNAGLIDELSLLILPIADSTPGTNTVFEAVEGLALPVAPQLHLKDVQRLEGSVLWLKYQARTTADF
ncbi:MAG: RibD family protein [Chitinophagaceae bacterium]